MDYLENIKKFDIVDKSGQRVPFEVNKFQRKFLEDMQGKDIILKCRQIGFTSLILAMFTIDFLTKENSRSVCISHNSQSAQKLLDRVKFYIKSLEEKGLVVDLKYNSRSELVNASQNSSFYIGQSGSKAFGRGDTLTNLHLSEFAFYPDPENLLSSVLQAVVPDGRVVMETTANGVNYFKSFWDKSKAKQTTFTTHFYGNDFYSEEFLAEKKLELSEDKFKQEYPSNDLECFLNSGSLFFPRDALIEYLSRIKEPQESFETYYDLQI